MWQYDDILASTSQTTQATSRLQYSERNMADKKIELGTQLLKGFKNEITQNTQLTAKLIDKNGDKREIKIPRNTHEDVLCLYALITATHHTDQEVEEALEILVDEGALKNCGSFETYQKGCTNKPTQTLTGFCEKYDLPIGNLTLMSSKFRFQCERSSVGSSLRSSKGRPNASFIALMTWYVSLMFGADTLKEYISQSRAYLDEKGRYDIEEGKIFFDHYAPKSKV